MQVLIKMTAGAEYSRDDYNTALKSIRGQWVNVDTRYLFRDQYNLVTPAIRVYDKDIDAVRDDARRGLVKCGYCGAQFHGMDALQAHYRQEENSAHNCTACRDYVTRIVDTIHETTRHTDDDGNDVETCITKYIHGKKCRWATGCNKFEHRNYKPEVFTPENTFFLKYPDGYPAYFNTLPAAEKWAAMGFIWDPAARAAEYTRADTGTYSMLLTWTPEGWELIARNTRTKYQLPADMLKYCLSNCYNIDYCITWGPDPDDKHRGKYADRWTAIPQATRAAVTAAIEYLRDQRAAAYKREFIDAEGGRKQ